MYLVLLLLLLLLHLDFNLFSNYETMIDGDCACVWARIDSPFFFLFDTYRQENRKKNRKREELNKCDQKKKNHYQSDGYTRWINEVTTTLLLIISNSIKNRTFYRLIVWTIILITLAFAGVKKTQKTKNRSWIKNFRF